MSLIGMLGAGRNGMMTAQTALQVAGNNVANASTPGYSRKSAVIESLSPYGLGSRVTGIRRATDRFVEMRMLGAGSESGASAGRTRTLGSLDAVFASGPGSIGDALASFQTAISDVASDPGARAPRTSVLERGAQLARAFQSAAGQLDTARTDANGRITDLVSDVNQKLHAIADLNEQIVRQEATVGGDASDLRDKRTTLVQDIAHALPVQSFEDGQGRVAVLLGGTRNLVSITSEVTELRTSAGANGDVRIERTTAGATEDVTAMFTSGEIGGTIEARDGALASARDALDQLATDVASAFDAVHVFGVGLDGGTGRNLFDAGSTVAGAAARFAVSADVAGMPDRIAAATSAASLPGDNRNALALQSVSTSKVAASGTMTISQSYAAIVGASGSAVRDANLSEEHSTAVLDQVTAARDAASGVSTDEEMVAIMQFQRSYQASLKVIQTADELLGDLMNLKR